VAFVAFEEPFPAVALSLVPLVALEGCEVALLWVWFYLVLLVAFDGADAF
jgi:hypothetical protein